MFEFRVCRFVLRALGMRVWGLGPFRVYRGAVEMAPSVSGNWLPAHPLKEQSCA